MRYGDLLGKRTVFTTCSLNSPAPLVSVVMATYSRHAEGMLTRCLDSVINQTFNNFEFIVMDDGSTDGTEQVLHDLALRDTRLIHVRMERNSGLPGVLLNEAVRMAHGLYIAFMFDDNEWFPNALSDMIQTARTCSADLIHGKAYIALPGGERVVFGQQAADYENLVGINPIPNGAVLITRKFVDQYGLYNPHIAVRRLYDWELWLRARKLGAQFAFVDEFITTEYGPTSPSSLGNSVQLNYPISVAYLQDEHRLVCSAAQLRPEAIDEFDIFSPEQMLQYVRNLAEWDAFEEVAYKPLLQHHPEYVYEPPLQHNRLYDHESNPYTLTPVFSIFTERKRTLLICNRVTVLVNEVRRALQANSKRIIFLAPQWGETIYTHENVDEVVIFDIAIEWIRDFALKCRDAGIPVVLVQQYSHPHYESIQYQKLRSIHQIIFDTPQNLFAFPGLGLDERLAQVEAELMEAVDQVVCLQPGSDKYKLQFISNWIDNLPPAISLKRCCFAGDLGVASPHNIRIIKNLAEQGWQIWIFSNSLIPADWPKTVNFVRMANTLPTCVQANPAELWTVSQEILAAHDSFDCACMEEDLLRGGGLLVDLEAAQEDWNETKINKRRLEIFEKHCQAACGNRADARQLHLRNILDGVVFRRKVAKQREKNSAQSVEGRVFNNSQAIGGSEAVGMQIVWAFNRAGIPCRLCAPANVNIHPGGLEMINNWLVERGLPPATMAEYGMVNYALHRQQVDGSELESLVQPLRQWMAQENPDWLLASAIIPEPAVAAAENQICFMSMFSPWDYPLHRLTFLRDFVDGGFSDSAWAVKEWSAWLQPPFGVVRSLVEPDRFQEFNRDLQSEPIQIAVIGALQPRKRQREAILAAQILLQRGYRLALNFYGYEFAGFTEFIEGLKSLAEQPDLAGHVHIHGFVEDMDEILTNNHIVCSASGDESLPNSLLQAMAAGLIPVAAQAGGIEEAIEDNVTGFLAHGFSTQDLADALERAILARPHWPEIANRARRWVADHCSEPAFVSNLLSMMLQATEIWAAPGSRYNLETRSVTGLPAGAAPPQSEYIRKFLTLAEENRSRPGPELNSAPLIYHLKPERDGWCGFRLRFGTYYHQPAGRLLVEVRKPGSHLPIRRLQVDLGRVHDNEWLELLFDPIRRSLGCDFEVHISAQITSGRLVVYEVLPAPLPVHMVVLRAGQVSRRYLKARLPIHRSGLAILPVYHWEDAND
jgi:glycosyltransferase involved in cell wall biosynthesis